MFEASPTSGQIFKGVIEAVKEQISDANFECTPEGITLQAMDSSHVSLVAIYLDPAGFSRYRCDKDITLGVNLASFSRILRCSENDDIITLRADDNPDILTMEFDSANGPRRGVFELGLMDIDADHLSIPDQIYDAKIEIPSQTFIRICRDASFISEAVVIDVKKNGFTFITEGEFGKGNITLKPNPEEKNSIKLKVNKPVRGTFAIRYFVTFSRSSMLSGHVTLYMSDKLPILVECNLNEVGYIKYYLAPKMEPENGDSGDEEGDDEE